MSKSKVIVTLDGGAGPLDRAEVTYTPGDDPGEAANLALHSVIDRWVLSPGDTIKISREV